ncbi:hypothetical protein R3W88_032021 [Solanum pinnatisectum]|uniref:Myb/SANT-like domain-containing protein n=1 Tax=Solanum pinnatisectum TaxID=50273 RepID=A0AAV9LN09_9SOLN|nr:hypothetical protein R3W88_032021 [Solanum pinnatisectum]
MPKTQTNAKWDDDAHLKFIKLCKLEIRKVNRPNPHLSRDGWKNMTDAFNEKMGRLDSFKQLMRGHTCIGWDATKNTIMADDDWWNKKIKVHFSYCSIACASNQPQFFETGVNFDEERINGIDNDGREHFINTNDEGSDESDDPQDMDSIMFPMPSLKRHISTDGIETSNQVKKSKTKSTAASMKEDMHSLVKLMSNKSTTTFHAVDDPTIDKCMDFLASIPGIFERGEMYNYFVNMFLRKDIRQVFLKMPTGEARKSWMEYNYQLYLKKM